MLSIRTIALTKEYDNATSVIKSTNDLLTLTILEVVGMMKAQEKKSKQKIKDRSKKSILEQSQKYE